MFGEATRESCNICFLLFCFASLGWYERAGAAASRNRS
uniref:Uncharacterized protein n=1 Tax=Anopheles dirus TaxID=7168 RepID=A0A182NX62_9DIPT